MYKALNKGVVSGGYNRFQISKKTLMEMLEMLNTNPEQLKKFLELAITLRCTPVAQTQD
jgi:hypothetical protein